MLKCIKAAPLLRAQPGDTVVKIQFLLFSLLITLTTAYASAQTLLETDTFLDELSETINNNIGDNSTREEIGALQETITEQVEHAESQVSRYKKHQWGGLNRSRKRKLKRWKKRLSQLLDFQETVVETASRFDDQTRTTGGIDKNQNNNAQLASIQAQKIEVARDLDFLNRLGVEDSPFTASELLGLKKLGSSPETESPETSGSPLKGKTSKQRNSASLQTKNIDKDNTVEPSSSSSVGRAIENSSSSNSAGGPGKLEIAAGQVLSLTEANTLNTSFLGEPIGISGASLFGIVSKKYRDKDQSKTFLVKEN